MQNIIAIICDCDDTLAPDTTSFLLENNGIDSEKFFENITNNFVQNGWDPPLAYLTEILKSMKSGRIKQNTKQKLEALGQKIKPFNGVTNFIPELKRWMRNDSDFIKAGINLECYIISSGIEDLVRGCSFAKHFTDIFAAKFVEHPRTKKFTELRSSVTFTEKTKFLYAINKGILGDNLRRYPYLVNNAIAKEQRRIPFEHMIYIGDGPSDIPCFSAVRTNGGHCIGILDKKSTKRAYELARGKRTNYGIYSRNFRNGSDLREMLKTIMIEVRDRIICNM